MSGNPSNPWDTAAPGTAAAGATAPGPAGTDRVSAWIAAANRLIARRPAPVLVALVCIAVGALWPYRHFAGDDAYITFRFASNFAAGHGFSFNPDVPVYGSTAPLWLFCIVGVHALGLDFPTAAHALNWLFLICNVIVFFALAGEYLGRNLALVGACVLLLVDPWFARWSMSGMENGLALFLLMSLLWSRQRRRNAGGIDVGSAAAAALAGLCRPEMCLLSVLLIVDVALHERKRKAADLAAVIVADALVLLPWAWYVHTHFDSLIPTTVRAKLSSAHVSALVHSLEYFASFWPFQAAALLAVALFALRGTAGLRIERRQAQRWFLPVAWGVILPTFYIIGGAPVAGRYMMLGLPSYLLVGVKSWSILWRFFPRLILAGAAATVVLVLAVQYQYGWYVTRWPQGMDPKMIRMAETLRAVSAADAVVAGDQIGVLGYFSGRRVLDTYGLASPEILPVRKVDDRAVWRYVHSRRPEFLFVSEPAAVLAGYDPAYARATLIEQEDVQREGSGAAGATTRYYLYRTHWDERP